MGERRNRLIATVVAAACVVVVFAPPAAASASSQPASPRATDAHGHYAGRVDIGDGRRIYLECRGSGSPTVILESGVRGAANGWSLRERRSDGKPVFPAVARFTRVCAYDRPGTVRDTDRFSRSDPVPMPRTAADAVADLRALLRAADVPGPYVLVGHSLGGLMVRLYASTYPNRVAGLVLVDALSEKLKPLLGPKRWAKYASFQLRPLPGFEDYTDLETIDFIASATQMRQAEATAPLPAGLPLVVLSKGHSFGAADGLGFPIAALDRAWRLAQDKLAQLVPQAQHVIVRNSGHDIHIERPRLVIRKVRQVVGS